MGYRLKINKFPNLEELPKATRILAQIPHLTVGVIRHQLQNVPWELPSIQDGNQLKIIAEELKKMGAEVSIYELPSKVPQETEDVQNEQNEEPKSIKTGVVLKSRESGESPEVLIHSTFEKNSEESFQINSEKSSENNTEKQGEKIKKTMKIAIYAGLGVFIILFVGWFLQESKEKTDNSDSVSAFRENTRSKQKQSKMKVSPKIWNQRVQATKESFQLYQQYQSDEKKWNFEQKIEQLKKILRKNPYHTAAWKDLEQQYLRSGHKEKARVIAAKAEDQNNKVRTVLKSLSDRFGKTREPIHLTPAEVQLWVAQKLQKKYRVGQKKWQIDGEKLGARVQGLHPNKKVTVVIHGDKKYGAVEMTPNREGESVLEWKEGPLDSLIYPNYLRDEKIKF